MLTMEMIREAQERLRGVARVTPLNGAKTLGRNVYMKAENLQLTGAFKLRGAYNKLCTLTEEERARGVIACSAGQPRPGVALSATRLGTAPSSHARPGPPQQGGGHQELRGQGRPGPRTYDDAAAEADRLAAPGGLHLRPPLQRPLRHGGPGHHRRSPGAAPEADQVVVPIGGGGLISGVAYAIKQLKPSCRVIGVQAAGAASMYTSRQAGEVLTLPAVATIADGIAVKRPAT